jgi:hypothetical protein
VKVFLLIHCVNNGHDNWDHIIAAYADETEAELEALSLNENNSTNAEFEDWSVSTYDLKGFNETK